MIKVHTPMAAVTGSNRLYRPCSSTRLWEAKGAGPCDQGGPGRRWRVGPKLMVSVELVLLVPGLEVEGLVPGVELPELVGPWVLGLACCKVVSSILGSQWDCRSVACSFHIVNRSSRTFFLQM